MRIRKRAVPLPLSLLSPVPFPPSDPHLVQLPSGFQSSDHLHLLPPDQPLSSGNDRRPGTSPPPTAQLRVCLPYEEDEREEISNPSKRIDSGAVAGADHGLLPFPSTPSSAHEKDSRWCDGDKAIPLKKRKASFEMNGVVVSEGESKMKSRTNKKCTLSTTLELLDRDDDLDDDYSVDDSDDDPISTDDDGKTKKKKKKKKKTGKKGGGGGAKKKAEAGKNKKKKKKQKKGGSIMEGSRCSRVNGRGWRCMQPTLVGYSLCEHHLGKGRLRSMSSVPAAKPDNAELGHSGNIATQQDYSGVGVAVAGSKTKRRRIGMVKARSLSSLLGQPNTPVVQLGSTTTTAAATTTGDYKHMHEIN